MVKHLPVNAGDTGDVTMIIKPMDQGMPDSEKGFRALKLSLNDYVFSNQYALFIIAQSTGFEKLGLGRVC